MRRCLSIIALILLLPHRSLAQDANVLVAYYSMGGHTTSMAEAVARGVETVGGVTVKLLPVDEVTVDDLLEADAVIVGSPVHSGNLAVPVQQFINRWPFEGSPMKDKVGAAFVTAGGMSAGEETTQLAILRSMLIYGMVVVGGPEWMGAFGASAITEEPPFDSPPPQGLVHQRFLDKGEALGRRVAEMAARLGCAFRPRP